jgi:hypothetical protein
MMKGKRRQKGYKSPASIIPPFGNMSFHYLQHMSPFSEPVSISCATSVCFVQLSDLPQSSHLIQESSKFVGFVALFNVTLCVVRHLSKTI